MVREATLRLGVDARGATQSLEDFRRTSERVNITVQQTTVSTDRLEKKIDMLTIATRQGVRNSALMADGIDRIAKAQIVAAPATERTTAAMGRQTTAGRRLGLMFGDLAAKTAKTGGAFLAVDFLARVAGATSLMGALNDILNAMAGTVRELATGPTTFMDRVEKAAKESTQSLDEYLNKLAEIRVAQAGPRVLLGGSGAFQGQYAKLPPSGAESNPYFARQIEDAFETYRTSQRDIIRGGDRGDQTTFALQRTQVELQKRLDAIGAEYDLLQRNLAAWAREEEKAKKATADWAKILERGASTAARIEAGQSARRGQAQAAAFGVPIASAFATPFIQYGQRQAQAQGYASDQVGVNQPWNAQGVPGGMFTQSIVANSARYAGFLAVINERQREAAETGERMGQSIAGSFEDALFTANSLEEGLEMVARAAIRAAFSETVTANLASSIGSVFSAKGNVFAGGNVVPFANGGILSGPIAFPMNGGKTGVAGEAGPEAIMPLGRNAKGELGVKGGQTVIVNISTPDVAGFRQSRRQIAQDVQRAIRG